jgi:vesicle coat complex subunit
MEVVVRTACKKKYRT